MFKQMVKQRNSNVKIRPVLQDSKMKPSKFVKTLLNVALRKTEVENPLLPRVILTSKKERLLFCSKSNKIFKFFCLVFIYLANDNK